MRNLTLAALLLAGCGDKDPVTDDTGTTTEDPFSNFIYVTDAPVGDFTGFEAGYVDAWLAQSVDAAKQVTAAMTGTVEDFETEDEVEEATVEIFHNNDPTGTPDQVLASDGDGNFSGQWPVCAPVAYSTFTDPALEETKVTFQVNEIYGYSEDKKTGSVQPVDATLNSVSSSTYQVIPSLLGVSPDPDKGIVAGTVYDLSGDPVYGAQVVAVDASGNIPDSLVVKYFVDDFPNREQEWTSADGLFVMVNVPTGNWTLEAYVSDGAGGHLLMGATNVNVIADSINISSVYIGYGDGISYPSSCLTE